MERHEEKMKKALEIGKEALCEAKKYNLKLNDPATKKILEKIDRFQYDFQDSVRNLLKVVESEHSIQTYND